jgi:CubicO group peptidase (beta-lactamase class C family)
MLIQELSQEGKLKLSDSLGKFIPEYIHKNVTLEQLLTHTSGIPNFTANNDYLTVVMTKSLTPKEIVLSFCSDSLDFKSGESFRYSNSGYVVLAAVIEVITGHPYGKVLKEKILDPLKMDYTSFGSDSLNTTGYNYGKREPKYKIANMAGAGGMSSTINDLAKWNEGLSNNALIQSDKLDEMFKPKAEYTDWQAYYGYGWMIDRFMFKSSKNIRLFIIREQTLDTIPCS